jgi:anthranilate synthase component 1
MINEISGFYTEQVFTASQSPVCNSEVVHSSLFDPEGLMSVLRNEFKQTYWMECNDLYEKGESMIIIAAQPLAAIEIDDIQSATTFKQGKQSSYYFKSNKEQVQFVDKWIKRNRPLPGYNCSYNGIMGYCSYNAVQLSEDIKFSKYTCTNGDVPLLKFNLYKYIFVFRKSAGEIVLINNEYGEDSTALTCMKNWLHDARICSPSPFRVKKEVETDCSELEFINKAINAKTFCMKGDVFQVVLSRRFSRGYHGDPWEFFTNLKKINVSPFMFYLDEGDFQITGTSPEIHFQAVKGEGCINPIAGTYKRSGSKEQEAALVDKLLSDPKENAEHVMLVDLARNDLNKIASKVHVSQFKKIEKYSHVMHIVSCVKGSLPKGFEPFRSVMDVFPAGTLSGAPKYRAMQVIDELENSSRSFYGGLLGWIGFNGDINTCIIIRSAMFREGVMTYRAGAGIVESSVPELELEEVNNKLRSISIVLEKFQE